MDRKAETLDLGLGFFAYPLLSRIDALHTFQNVPVLSWQILLTITYINEEYPFHTLPNSCVMLL